MPALPSFFPVSRNVDSVVHFEIIESIAKNNVLEYSQTRELDVYLYPTGMRLIAAFVTRLLNIDPIQIIYPFIVIITVLTAGIVYGIVVESNISNKFFGLIPACITLSFFLTSYATMVMGWWTMVFGIYLVLAFMWLLLDYIKMPAFPQLLPLIIIEVAIIFSYNFWALIPALTLFITLLTNSNISKKAKGIQFAIFTLIVGGLTINFINIALFSAVNKTSTGPSMSFLPFGFFNWRENPEKYPMLINSINNVLTVYFTIGIIGGIKYIRNKKYDILMAFFIASFLQTLTLGIAALYFGFDLYFYAKSYNLLMYPAAIFLWMILKDILSRWNYVYKVKNSPGFKPMFLIILSTLVILSSYTMILGIKSTGHQVLAITPDQYDIALWTRDNLKYGNLTSLAEWPQGLWFTEISKRNFTSADDRYGVENADVMKLKFNKWELTSRNGDMIAILDISKIDTNIEVYDVIYRKGNAVILRNNTII
ncbi:MAG: hypothetical protein WA102_13355 [Candidatus Methanoperedens sp.]